MKITTISRRPDGPDRLPHLTWIAASRQVRNRATRHMKVLRDIGRASQQWAGSADREAQLTVGGSDTCERFVTTPRPQSNAHIMCHHWDHPSQPGRPRPTILLCSTNCQSATNNLCCSGFILLGYKCSLCILSWIFSFKSY